MSDVKATEPTLAHLIYEGSWRTTRAALERAQRIEEAARAHLDVCDACIAPGHHATESECSYERNAAARLRDALTDEGREE